MIPTDPRKPYDVREIIARVVDGSELDEFKPLYGTTLVTRLRAYLRLSGGHRRQQRHPVLRVGAQGRALHRAVLPARHPAGVPAEHHRLHGGQEVRGGRHRQGRRQDGDRGGDRARCRSSRSSSAAASAPATTACAAAPIRPRFLWMWPNARISVMGGEQAASVLATVRRDGLEKGRQDLERRGRRGFQGADPRAVRAPGTSLLRQRAVVGRRRHRPCRDPARAGPGHLRQPERADRADHVRRVSDVGGRHVFFGRSPTTPWRYARHPSSREDDKIADPTIARQIG